MSDTTISFSAAAITFFIGGSIFIHLLNRQLKHADLARGQVSRSLIIFWTWIVGASVITLAAFLFPGGWLRFYLLLACAGLVVIIAGEVRLVVQRLRYRGARPQDRLSLRFNSLDFVPSAAGNHSLLRPVTTTDLQILRYDVTCHVIMESSGSSEEIPLRVVAASDFHIHPAIPFQYYARVIEQINLQQPDLIFLPGDFATHLGDSARLAELLQGLKARRGVYASLGNHDYWAGSEKVAALVQQTGVHLLSNRSVELEYAHGASSVRMVISGCDDPWGSPLWEPPHFEPGQLFIVLSHTPDNIYRLARYPVAAVFSGHCHAGQFRIPGFGSLILPSEYGRRFDYGHFELKRGVRKDPLHLFVSAGIGSANPPVRLYCQPDIIVVNFKLTRL